MSFLKAFEMTSYPEVGEEGIPMECAGCDDRNVFNLGIVYCANSGDLVVLFRSVCAHRGGNKALAMLDLDLSNWTPLVNAMDSVFMRELFPPPLSGRKGVVEGMPEHSPNWEESMMLVMSWGMELTGLQRAMWKDLGKVPSLEELQEQWRARGESYLLSRVDGVVDNRHRDVPQVPKTFESVGEYTQEVFGPLLDTAAEVEKEIVEQAFFQGVGVEWKLRDGERGRGGGGRYATVPVS